MVENLSQSISRTRATCSLTTSFPLMVYPWMTASWMLLLGAGMPLVSIGSCFFPWAMLCVKKLNLTATQPRLSLIFLPKRIRLMQRQKHGTHAFVWLCIKSLSEIGRGLQVCVMGSEVVLHILQVTGVLQFWSSCTEHLEVKWTPWMKLCPRCSCDVIGEGLTSSNMLSMSAERCLMML